jgi:hypothetical protein
MDLPWGERTTEGAHKSNQVSDAPWGFQARPHDDDDAFNF